MNYVGSSRSKRDGGWVKWIVALVVFAAIGAGAWYFYPEIREALGKPGADPYGDPLSSLSAPDVSNPPDINGADTATPPDSGDTAWAALAEAQELALEDKLLEARDKLLKLIKDARDLGRTAEDWREAETLLGKINVELVTTPRQMPGKVVYSVQEGDTLGKIIDKFVCPQPHIVKMNPTIRDVNHLRPGNVLRVMDHPKYEILISKKDNTLVLTFNGDFFKRYTVGTGEYGKTPVGTFVIDDKVEEPVWWKDGKDIPFSHKENILGTRWLRIAAKGETLPVSGYGIHGTWDDSTLGKQSSAGCIRMNNADVEEIFMLVPRGTTVTITE